ncbi:Glycerol-3-phosphate acyltransferase 4 [Geodia barretti]|uniref:Glycerol-3-phosphate acyltransferase 4 n=1 Tax=Geodia barretti TaxID=519541 RepID=A0AA35TYJ3_GEOBA|nr:Glycerol-3-phosphate acyltransferase 4 [Geodia barretti]
MFWLTGAAILAGYLLGSFPTAYLAGRFITPTGTDITSFGDGNAGAANVGRLLGARWGIIIAAVDIAKGVAAVFAETVDRVSAAPGMLAGAAALVGHVWPVWTRFRGGRGAATAAGVMSAILSWPVLIMFAPTMAILYLTRSTTAALAFAYLSTVAVAKVIFGVSWGPISYCLALFVAVGLIHLWSVLCRARPSGATVASGQAAHRQEKPRALTR